MKYIAAGSVITNRIWYKNGSLVDGVMGGCGMFALEGMYLGTKESMLSATVGPDFDDYYGKWFDRNGMSRDGLCGRLYKTLYNELVYLENGTFVEYSIYDPKTAAHDEGVAAVVPDDYEPFLEDCKGMYMLVPPEGKDLEKFEALKKKYGFGLMWEYNPGSRFKNGREWTFDFIDKYTDIYSLNRPESYELFETQDEESTIKKIMELGKPCYYRVGSKGAYMVEDGKAEFVPVVNIVPHEQEIDPTGCGNSSTAAAAWAYFEGFDILMNGIWGNVVAGYNVQQYGPYPVIDDSTRKQAMDKAKELYQQLKH
ncbi:MAG: carbohydrate kinase family protein [Oscillospiraceae bacterium]|jgi:hypothetical protein